MVHKTRPHVKTYFIDLQTLLEIIKYVAATITLTKFLYEILKRAGKPSPILAPKHIDILQVLAQRGPLKLTHIMYKANVNCSVLKEYLDFLVEQGLVEERIGEYKRFVYAITQRGNRSVQGNKITDFLNDFRDFVNSS